MTSQATESPAIIQKLDSKTYAFNYDIVATTSTDEDGNETTTYTYETIVINTSNLDSDKVVKQVLLQNWDVNAQLKLINDYKAYEMGILTDEKYQNRYEEFLQFRAEIKDAIDNTVI